MLSLALATLLAAAAQGEHEHSITVPIKGIATPDQAKTVQEALARIDGVKSVALRKVDPHYEADLVTHCPVGLPLSEIEKALAATTLQVEMDVSLDLAFVHYFVTKEKPERGKLGDGLSKLKGYRLFWTTQDGFGVVIDADQPASHFDVRKAAGLTVTDLVLAPQKGGFRYYCLVHTRQVSPVPASCGTCKSQMSRVSATRLRGEKPAENSGTKCDSCGAATCEEGCKRGCVKCQKKCGSCQKQGGGG